LERDLELYATLDVGAVGLYLDKVDAAGAERAIDLVQSAGLRVVEVFTRGLVPQDPSSWPGDRARILRAIEVAARVGAPCVMATTGAAWRLSWSDAVEALRCGLEPTLAAADEHGIRLATEHTNSQRVEVGFIHSLHDLLDVVRALGMSAVMECNYCWSERDLDATIRSGVSHIALVQMSDLVVPSTTIPDRAVPGDGVIPLTEILATLLDAGYCGDVELEMLGPRIEAEGYEAALRRALTAMDEILAAAGA